MSDDDGDWKPNGRPQSTIALSFSAALNDAFNIDSYHRPAISLLGPDADIGDLSQHVEQKKQEVSSQSQELEALEARLRATEERLRQKQSATNSRSASPLPPPKDNPSNTPRRGPPAVPGAGAFRQAGSGGEADTPATYAQYSSREYAQQPQRPAPTRPQYDSHASDRLKSMPGALPETPGEYDDDEFTTHNNRGTGPKERATVHPESDYE